VRASSTVRGLKNGADAAWVQIERLHWLEYSRGRFENEAKRELARRTFLNALQKIHNRLRTSAVRAGARMDVSGPRLRLIATAALPQGCEYCLSVLTFTAFDIVFDRPPNARRDLRGFDGCRLAVCCPRCAVIKGNLSGEEWRDVLTALKTADPLAREAFLLAVERGRTVKAVRSRKGTPEGVPPCG
jgi:hypothetical protein